MQQYLTYAPVLLYGLGFAALLFIWRKAALRWGSWFPLLKKGLEWSLMGGGLANAVYAAMYYRDSEVLAGPAFLIFLAGVVLPEAILRQVRLPKDSKEETKRGAQVGNNTEISRKIRNSKTSTYLKIGGVPIPVSAESYHFLIAGSTGTGKSVAINAMLQQIRERGDTAIVVDSGGNFLEKHYNPDTDFVFNPYDSRCVGWSPTAEMQGVWDAQALARSIVPDGVGDSKEWNSYAQTFVGAVLRKLWELNRLTLQDFLYYVQVAPRAELQELLSGTAAASQLSSERTFGSIRTIAGNYVTSYDYLPSDKTKFSVTEMIQAEHSGVLFMTYRDDQLDSLRNLMACLLDVASRAILSLEPNPNRRVWLIIDEFASIGRVQSIEAVATKARKAGGCLVLGIQSVSQLRDRYGDNGAQTILSCMSTWLVLRCADSDTAEYMSKYIGEAEISRQQQGLSNSDTGETQSWSEQSSIKRVVLGSQLQAMPNLTGMLKLLGDYPVCEVKLPIPVIKGRGGLPFIARDFKANPLPQLLPSVPFQPAEASTSSSPILTPAVREAEPRTQSPAFSAQQYLDKTPRPKKPQPRNVLVEVAQGLIPLRERVMATSETTEVSKPVNKKEASPVTAAAALVPLTHQAPLSAPLPAPAPSSTPAAPTAAAFELSQGTASYLLSRLHRSMAAAPPTGNTTLGAEPVKLVGEPVIPAAPLDSLSGHVKKALTAPSLAIKKVESSKKPEAMPEQIPSLLLTENKACAPELVTPSSAKTGDRPKTPGTRRRRRGDPRTLLDGLLR